MHSWVPRTLKWTIRDAGQPTQDHVLGTFSRPSGTAKETTGTGLGLWVSSEIIAKHRATVRVASRPADPGSGKQSGTVFMLFFPEDGIGSAPLPQVATTQSA